MEDRMTFGGHLEVLRRMLFRVLAVVLALAIVVFCFKEQTFTWLLAPSEWDFVTYRAIERLLHRMGSGFTFNEFHVNLIATDLSSQFMTHVTTAFLLGALCASPYLLFELYRFIIPALYAHEKRHAVKVAVTVYLLFVAGVLMSYYVLFPVSFRFLGTYSVAERVVSNITLDSYIRTFTSLTLVMGLVFQLPVLTLMLGKMGLLRSTLLARYRKYALLVILLIAAVITPPDLMTLLLVALPLYLLYEVSRLLLKRQERKK
ncbi:MAG: twin-arginine translocase subunit TatC [Bacteroidales bacterium]|nr:twin-arginine translocase subunit TatC [Bacteroidales bacterium]